MNNDLKKFLTYLALEEMPFNKVKELYKKYKSQEMKIETDTLFEKVGSLDPPLNAKSAKELVENALKVAESVKILEPEQFKSGFFINGQHAYEVPSPYTRSYKNFFNETLDDINKNECLESFQSCPKGITLNDFKYGVISDRYWNPNLDPKLKEELIKSNPEFFGKWKEEPKNKINNDPQRDEAFISSGFYKTGNKY